MTGRAEVTLEGCSLIEVSAVSSQAGYVKRTVFRSSQLSVSVKEFIFFNNYLFIN